MKKLYPSPFSAGERFHFENKHGQVILEAVTQPQAISSIRLINAPKECLMSWDEMGQIALITDQERLQPVCGFPLRKRVAFIRHETASSAGWVKVVQLNYICNISAKEQIERDLQAGRNAF